MIRHFRRCVPRVLAKKCVSLFHTVPHLHKHFGDEARQIRGDADILINALNDAPGSDTVGIGSTGRLDKGDWWRLRLLQFENQKREPDNAGNGKKDAGAFKHDDTRRRDNS